MAALVALALAGVAILLFTSVGKAKVLDYGLEAVNRSIVGRVHVDRLSGFLLEEFVLADVKLYDEDETSELLRVDEIRGRYEALAFFGHEAKFDSLEIRGLSLQIKETVEGYNVLHALQPRDVTEEGEPWDISIQKLSLSDASIAFVDRLGREWELQQLSLEASDISIAEQNVVFAISDLSTYVPYCDRTLSLRAEQILREGDRIVVTGLHIESGPSEIDVQRLTLDLDTTTFDISGHAIVDETLLECLLPNYVWRRSIAIDVSASREKLSSEILFKSSIDGDTLIASGVVDSAFESGSMHVEVADWSPDSLIAMEHSASVDGGIDVTFRGFAHEEPLEVSGTLAATVDGYRIDDIGVAAKFTEPFLEWDVEMHAGDAVATSTGSLNVSEMSIKDAEGGILIPELSQNTENHNPASGELSAKTTFSGPLDSLKVSGTIESKRLQMNELRVRSGVLHFSFSELGQSWLGKLNLIASSVRYKKQLIRSVEMTVEPTKQFGKAEIKLHVGSHRLRVDLKAVATLSTGNIRNGQIDIESIAVRRYSARLSGNSGRIQWFGGNEISVSDLNVSGPIGTVRIAGDLVSGLRATLSNIDVGKMGPALKLREFPVSGQVRGMISMRRDEAGSDYSIQMHASNVRMRLTSPAIALDISASTQHRGMKLSFAAESEGAGRVGVSGYVKTPSDLFSSRQWALLVKRGTLLRSAKLHVHNFELESLAAIRPGNTLSGRLDGDLAIGHGGNEMSGTLGYVGVEWPGLDLNLSGEVDITKVDSELVIQASIKDDELGGILSRLHVPTNTFSSLIQGWNRKSESRQELFLRLGQTLHVDLNHLDLLKAKELFVDSFLSQGSLSQRSLSRPLSRLQGGIVDGTFKINHGSITATMNVQDVKTQLYGALNGKIEIESDAHVTAYHIEATHDGGVSLSSRGRVDRGWRESLINPHEMVSNAQVDASVDGSAMDLSRLSHLVPLPKQATLGGALIFRAKVQGGLDHPTASTTISIQNATVNSTDMGNLNVNATHSGGDWVATLIHGRPHGGSLRVVAEGKTNSAIDSISVRSKNYDISVAQNLSQLDDDILASVAGKFNANFVVTNPLESPDVQGWASVRSGKAQLSSALMPLEEVGMMVRGDGKNFTVSGTGQSGEGTFRIAGGGTLNGRRFPKTLATIELDRLPVAIGAIVYSMDGAAHMEIAHRPGLWMVDMVIDEGRIRVPINSFGGSEHTLHAVDGLADVQYVSELNSSVVPSISSETPVARIKISAPNTLRIESKGAEAIASADLDVTFMGITPIVVGQTKITKGRVNILNRLYLIDRAVITFRGHNPINPALDIKLRHDFDALRLDVIVDGTLDEPLLHFESDPAEYDQSSLLAIVLGQAPGKAGDRSQLENQALGVASNIAIIALQEALGSVLPIEVDVMRVEPTENAGNSYVVGKWITDDWFVTYRFQPDAAVNDNVNEVVNEYRLSKSWRLDGTVGTGGKHGADILWIRRWGD